MKIAHVVTYISPDGAFGGPVRVALGQAAELAKRGHEVTVFAASPDDAPKTFDQDGYSVRTFPAKRVHRRLGFAGMYAPGLTKALRSQLHDLDVVHVHLARDLVTLPAARAARKSEVRLIAQPHGMIDKSSNPLAGPVDAWEVRAALTSASAVLTLTDQESKDIADIAPDATVRQIRNGIRGGDLPPYANRNGGVLFLARLHPRKRPLAFVEMATVLLERGITADFVLAGPDEGESERVQEAISSSGHKAHISWAGAVDPALTDTLLRDAKVLVLPSVGEVFPMTVLEAFAAGTPVVTTSSLGIASKCEEYGAALVTDGSPSDLADAVEKVLTGRHVANALRESARRFIDAELSIEAVTETLLASYAPAGARRA
ncbi:glycosyltransferase [Microbacterium sp. ZXX196]|uniref:glycosyltransferase n=1 Tax=Microbacterium sp. ZXX196 TaxID=2609291 RepID=UPI0012B90896|nr:glycosyltransferase [Microbacterium sp. ZXX196]MTE23275.1 glycosyltransferase [Microbacterium sp. ZXX196]